MSHSIRMSIAAFALTGLPGAALLVAADDAKYDPVAEAARVVAKMNVKPGDSPQFLVSHYRNNVSVSKNVPTEWDVDSGKNVKWTGRIGSQTYGSPAVANGKVFVATNN